MKINNDKSKNDLGKIIIIEGLWATGKTTLCKYLKKYHGFYFLPEPNHLKAGFKKEDRKSITNWYFKEHIKNFKYGLNIARGGENVVIERSPIASMAFEKAHFGDKYFSDNKFSHFQKLLTKGDKRLCIILLKHGNIKLLAQYLGENKYTKIYSDEKFLKKFNNHLSSFIRILNKKNLIYLAVIKSNKSLIKNFRTIILKFL